MGNRFEGKRYAFGFIKKKKVHGVFEKISEDYDKMNSVISFNQHKKWREDIMRRMAVRNGAKILDVCCGTADWTIALAKAAGSTGEVTGLDFSENMLEAGKPKVEAYPTITLMHGNAMALPFPDHSFDYVTIGFGLRNVPDYGQVLSEINRVLKPGGMIACLKHLIRKFQCTSSYSVLFKFIMPVLGKLFCYGGIHGFKNPEQFSRNGRTCAYVYGNAL